MDDDNDIVAAGRTAELLAYGAGRVLKLYREGFPAEAAKEEFRVSTEVYRSGFSVPCPFEMTVRDGRAGIVYEKAEGMTMLAAISRDPSAVKEEARRMARLHAEIHNRQVEGLPRQKTVLARLISEAPFLSEEEKSRITHMLEQLEDDCRLCHGDYHPDNIILGQKEWVIDWMTAVSGSPAADAARTVLLLKFGTLPDEMPSAAQQFFTRIREQLTNMYWDEYQKLTGISSVEIERWMVPVAAARLTEWIPAKEKEQLLALIRN